MRSRARAEPVSCDAFEQGEAPRVDGRTGELLWVDMRAGSLHTATFDGTRLATTFTATVGPRIGMVAPLVAREAGWVVAAGSALVHVAVDGESTVLVDGITPDGSHPLNDGVCSPDGALWVGSQSSPRAPTAALYRISPDLEVTTVLSAVTVSNGIGFTPDGATMYYIDTLPHRRLDAFDVVGARLANRRTIATLDGGNPDGLAADDQGCVWVAMWDGYQVRRISPGGEVVDVVEIPVPRPTAVALSDGWLFVTTARIGLDPVPPTSGRIFAAEVGVSAAPTPPWHGNPALVNMTRKETREP